MIVFFLALMAATSTRALDPQPAARMAKAVGEANRVMLLTGAGVSCGAGIPDFRSPGGMYSTLRPELLTATEEEKRLMRQDPTFVVEKRMFFNNPLPYHEVRRPFILGTQARQWKPTLFHRFVEALDKRGKLLRLVTQNIDGLDFLTETTADKIVPCHGTIARAACEACREALDFNVYCGLVRTQIKDIYGVDASAPEASTSLVCRVCGKPALKPTTVLFGSNLPAAFFESLETDLPEADLLIVAGTSLLVSPANMVAAYATCPRFVVDRQRVGEHLGLRFEDAASDDVYVAGDADDVFGRLMLELQWLDDIQHPDDLPPASRATFDALRLASRA